MASKESYISSLLHLPNLTNIRQEESAGTFGTASVPQRLKNQLLYHEISLYKSLMTSLESF